jgi:hypothetical protein
VRSEDGRMCRSRILSRGGGDDLGKLCGWWTGGRWRGGEGRVEGGDGEVLLGEGRVLLGEGALRSGDGRGLLREGGVESGDGRVLLREGALRNGDAKILFGDARVLSGEEVVESGDGRVLFGDGALTGGDGALLARTAGFGARGGGVVPTLGTRVLSCPSCLNGRGGVGIDRWPAERVAWDYGEGRLWGMGRERMRECDGVCTGVDAT